MRTLSLPFITWRRAPSQELPTEMCPGDHYYKKCVRLLLDTPTSSLEDILKGEGILQEKDKMMLQAAQDIITIRKRLLLQ